MEKEGEGGGNVGGEVTVRRFSLGYLEEPRHNNTVNAKEALAGCTSVL